MSCTACQPAGSPTLEGWSSCPSFFVPKFLGETQNLVRQDAVFGNFAVSSLSTVI